MRHTDIKNTKHSVEVDRNQCFFSVSAETETKTFDLDINGHFVNIKRLHYADVTVRPRVDIRCGCLGASR